jgi:hypothetical protein
VITWSGIETRTRGLIHGPATLATGPAATGRLWTPRSQLQRDLAKQEFFVGALTSPAWAPTHLHWKVVVAAREGGEILWQRPFADYEEAQLCYLRACGFRFDRWNGEGFTFPCEYVDGELYIKLATTATFNATNSTNADWPTGNKVPSGVTTVDYLCIAGGASGGSNVGGGGGAGGYKSATGFAVTPGTQVTITVGAGGNAQAVSNTSGNNGNNSVFDSVTSTGGGGGGAINSAAGAGDPKSGGSGGGASQGGTGPTTGGAASPAGQGNAGGNGTATSQPGGGGGASAAGGTGNGSHTGNGGAGQSSAAIDGTTRGGGGGGGGYSLGSTSTAGSGGSGGGGAGGAGDTNAGLTAGTANTGGGGGGSTVSASSAAGGSGVIILVFTARLSPVPFRRTTRFFRRSF